MPKAMRKCGLRVLCRKRFIPKAPPAAPPRKINVIRIFSGVLHFPLMAAALSHPHITNVISDIKPNQIRYTAIVEMCGTRSSQGNFILKG